MIELELKENQKWLQFTLSEQPSPLQWSTFITLQLLDVYTSYKGLKYDCVEEQGPLMGSNPTVGRMLTTKLAVLTPALSYDLNNGGITSIMMSDMNVFMAAIVAHNHTIYNKAKENCRKTP